jgi:hypothetical protein
VEKVLNLYHAGIDHWRSAGIHSAHNKALHMHPGVCTSILLQDNLPMFQNSNLSGKLVKLMEYQITRVCIEGAFTHNYSSGRGCGRDRCSNPLSMGSMNSFIRNKVKL